MNEEIKTLITNSTEPLVFHNLLHWKLLDWDLEKWNECMGNTKLQFRLGHKSHSMEPQWERTCERVKGTFEDFRNFKAPDQWLYFDYKYLDEWFVDKFDLRNEINWEKFGYPNIKAEDSTIWIGSEGAHTPCHKDTYGFNLVAQLSGSKLWLLFPPNTDFKATRIPWEESTIYSSINFYCPSSFTISSLINSSIKCKKVVLEPGQVLYVPNGWWHYVENLELAISINTWVPMLQDNDKRVSEAITLMIVKSLTYGLKLEELDTIVNNSNELQGISTFDSLNLIERSLENCKSNLSAGPSPFDIKTSTSSNFEQVQQLRDLTSDELKEFLKCQLDRFLENNAPKRHGHNEISSNTTLIKKYLSILSDPDVIELVKQKIKDFNDNSNEVSSKTASNP